MKNLPQQLYASGSKIYTHFLFLQLKEHVMLFSWIESQNDRVFLFGSGYRSAGGDTVRIKR